MGTPLRTTVGAPRFRLKYELSYKLEQATPRYSMLKLPRDEYERRYRAILDGHGVPELLRASKAISEVTGEERLVLLCFDDLRKPGVWCHRTMFAQWWLDNTGEIVPELQAGFGDQLQPS